ncbi:MAG: PQQ-binding-like beta-propeller repeat protein [Spirochaetota bacterium]|nr:PQQ-binding-like beta-propeller repeat protein [Spirochaetota bacterium]
MSFTGRESYFWRTVRKCFPALLCYVVMINGCQRDEPKGNFSADSEISSIPQLNPPITPSGKPLLSPRLLWKSYVGHGVIQHLVSVGHRDVYYIESPGRSGKELVVTAMDRRNGRKVYERRDRVSSFSKPVMTQGILYYAGESGYSAVDLSSGTKVILEREGVCHPVFPLDKEDNTMLMEKVYPGRDRAVVEYLCVDVRKKSVIWRKAGLDVEALVGKRYVVFQKGDKAIDVVERSTGRLSHRAMRLISSLHKDREVVRVQGDYLYVRSGSSLLSINCPTGKIAWRKDLSSAQSEYIASSQAVIVFRSGDNMRAFRVDDGKELWKRDHRGSAHKTISHRVIVMMTEDSLYGIDISTGTSLWNQSHTSKRGYPKYKDKEYLYFKANSDGRYLIRTVNPLNKPYINTLTTGDNGYDCYTWTRLNLKKFGSLTYLASVSARSYYDKSSRPSRLTLKAFDTASGKELWRYMLFTGDLMGQPALVDGSIIIGTNYGNLKAFQPTTGTPIWSYRISQTGDSRGEAIPFTVLKGQDKVTYAYFGGYIHALDMVKLKKTGSSTIPEDA